MKLLDNPYLSPGVVIILCVAVVSTLLALTLPIKQREGLEFWTFARNHAIMYQPQLTDWSTRPREQGGGMQVHIFTLDGVALQRRVLSGFWADTPLADLVEIEGNMFSKFVSGPLEDIGFVDLTDRLHEEGIIDQINAPSFSPWTNRGRIFGLPHDVHPVLLAYRADIVEDRYGIDVSQIETWDDFARVMKPVMEDANKDGRPDRYLLNFWFNDGGLLEVLMLQAGGGTFDPQDRLIIASEANARVVATGVSWCFGEGRLAIQAPDFDAGGNQLRLEGRVVCALMPDWLGGTWKTDLPQLSGKVKLMPLPAWEPGGRRTSVMGGTMMGITRASMEAGRFEDAWEVAKHLYLSEDIARELFEISNIISPVKRYWDSDFYRRPDPFFRGQQAGLMFIEQAPHVPLRTSHPFRAIARAEIGQAANELRAYADRIGRYSVDALLPEARRLLELAEDRVRQQMQRNVFLRETADSGDETDAALPGMPAPEGATP